LLKLLARLGLGGTGRGVVRVFHGAPNRVSVIAGEIPCEVNSRLHMSLPSEVREDRHEAGPLELV
jgi:hypothetical protein